MITTFLHGYFKVVLILEWRHVQLTTRGPSWAKTGDEINEDSLSVTVFFVALEKRCYDFPGILSWGKARYVDIVEP